MYILFDWHVSFARFTGNMAKHLIKTSSKVAKSSVEAGQILCILITRQTHLDIAIELRPDFVQNEVIQRWYGDNREQEKNKSVVVDTILVEYGGSQRATG